MSNKTIGILLIALGIIIVLVSLVADSLGIGNQMGIGWTQLLGAAIGVIMAIVGVWMVLRKSSPKN